MFRFHAKVVLALTVFVLAYVGATFDDVRADEAKPTAPVASPATPQPVTPLTRTVDYAKDVQPIFAASCYKCHGAEKQESGLRLHRKKDAFSGGDNGRAWLPGNSAGSRVIQFVTASDKDKLMPPPGEGQKLSTDQIGILKAWIDQGAKWPDEETAVSDAKHWAYTKPERPKPPVVKSKTWPRGPLDQFVLARLEAEGLSPADELDRARLLRRVSLDLIGLPPTPAEVEAFVKDTSHDAYEKVVERLLQSPHYGERWARPWLDLARYADTHGYEKDPHRTMWPYRDWVIDALNRDLPFDQFTIEQLAGDLLPGATDDQKVATGFHRNTMINTEGGVDNEEYRVAAVIDRVNTTGTAWLGTTLGCCQCHSHKYDPFKQKEYYRLLAFFNQTADPGNAVGVELSVRPRNFVKSSPEQIAALNSAKKSLDDAIARATERQDAWEVAALKVPTADWTLLQPSDMKSTGGAKFTPQTDGSILVEGKNGAKETYTITAPATLKAITGLRLEVLSDPSAPEKGLGRAENGEFALSHVELSITPSDKASDKKDIDKKANAKNGTEKKDTANKVAFRKVVADYSQSGHSADNLIAAKPNAPWKTDADQDGLRVPHTAVFVCDRFPIENKGENGEQESHFTITLANQSVEPDANLVRFRISVTDSAKPDEKSLLPSIVREVLSLAKEKRSESQLQLLRDYQRSVDPQIVVQRERIAILTGRSTAAPAVKTLVMKAVAKPRETHVFLGGNFMAQGDIVTPGVPDVLPPLKEDASPNRLSFAKWLVSPENPLTARVAVNRAWEQFFGRGIVATSEDFGTRGERPSHPELLDWLATEFIRQDWSVKSLHRLIVTSATYRQSGRVTPTLQEKDPNNRLFARGPRVRLEAELIRDQALAVSGLLSRKIGGPSVMPHQPDGIWSRPYSGEKWMPSEGADRYRRGLYTYWRRTAPYPSFMSFDAPSREVCVARRPRTNTPLQALTILNDPVYIEAAQGLARRMLSEAIAKDAKATALETSDNDRAEFGFRLCLSRQPTVGEVARLVELFRAERGRFQKDAMATKAMLGSAAGAANVDQPSLAAWTVVANVLLNLDEFLTRG